MPVKKDPTTELFTSDDATVEHDESFEVDDPFPQLEHSRSSVEDDLINSILGQEESQESIQRRQAALYLETGNYRWIKDDKFKVAVNFSSNDIRSTDLAVQRGERGKGRCFIKVSGNVENENGRRGSFEFMASPDVRLLNDRADPSTKNYEMLVKLYFRKHEKNPSPLEVLNMLKEADYSMYIALGNSRNYLNRFNA